MIITVLHGVKRKMIVMAANDINRRRDVMIFIVVNDIKRRAYSAN